MKPRAVAPQSPGKSVQVLKNMVPKKGFSEPGLPRLRILAISFQHDLARGVHEEIPGPQGARPRWWTPGAVPVRPHDPFLAWRGLFMAIARGFPLWRWEGT